MVQDVPKQRWLLVSKMSRCGNWVSTTVTAQTWYCFCHLQSISKNSSSLDLWSISISCETL